MDPIALDNLNRNIGGVINSLQALQNAISSATTGTPTKVGDSKSADELNNLMTKFVKDHKDGMDQQSNYLQEIVKAMNEGNKIKGERKTKDQGTQESQQSQEKGRGRNKPKSDDKEFISSVTKMVSKLDSKYLHLKDNIGQAVKNLIKENKLDDKIL